MTTGYRKMLSNIISAWWKIFGTPSNHPSERSNEVERRADTPQRYVANMEAYLARGGSINIANEVESFVQGSSNNATDLARFWMFCLTFDQIEKESLPGDIVEVGVYKGHTATLLARFARRTGRELFLFDTFEGFSSNELLGHQDSKSDYFNDTSLDEVRSFVGEKNVTFIKGHFPMSASELPKNKKFCLVHIDCDLYEPIRDSLEYFYSRVVDGGFLIIHDYASLWWPGAERAVDEFFANKQEAIILIPDISGSAIVRKSKHIAVTHSDNENHFK